MNEQPSCGFGLKSVAKGLKKCIIISKQIFENVNVYLNNSILIITSIEKSIKKLYFAKKV